MKLNINHFMKYFNLIIILIFVTITNTSCEKPIKTKQNALTTTNKTPIYQKITFNVKGMTCEIGCARLIESKLSKTKGIKFSKVVFKDSIGMAEYDINILNQQDIKKVVNNIADGTLYKIKDIKNVEKFKLKK